MMLRKIIILLCFIHIAKAQTKSPNIFFGYELGSKFHRHHEMVDYMQHLSQENKSRTKWIPYGKTNEGRPLFVLAISSIENISQLEEIRKSNLQMIGLLPGSGTVKVPAIAWLSYNVHGNEAVSMEAVMEVAYQLLANKNGEFDSVLSNTVILLDPCINPDGRDRYANWFNQKVGKSANANYQTWEHQEPWPSGRPNHYLFDLNRDWAWQVQMESQQRMKLYNSWMPHLHADFHEQGINSPYYFAPAAKPYHAEITSWQRDFQQKIGQYNKQEFDKKGWLYFSNERFDLLYPSYGDTYPTFNGAIGMTYEQGGSGRAGLAVVQDDADTLTLASRIAHHVSTSFAALKAISTDASKNVQEFKKFFDNSTSTTDYNSYIIKAKGQEFKLEEFKSLLEKLDIKYGQSTKSGTLTGYSYKQQKNASFNIEENDLVLSMQQPKSKFLKILMEPKTMVEDSLTYDITAWTLPYAYGLDAFAVKEKLPTKAFEKKPFVGNQFKEKKYAYIFDNKSFTQTKFLAQVQKIGIKVRQAELPFEISGRTFERGTLVITRAGNEKLVPNFELKLAQLAEKFNINIFEVATGMATKGFDLGSSNFRLIKNPKIAVVSGENVYSTAFGEVWHYLDQQIEYPHIIINPDQLQFDILSDIDVLILPNGRYGRALSPDKIGLLDKWISEGGKLIAMEKAIDSFLNKASFEIKQKEAKKDTSYNFDSFETRERLAISKESFFSSFKLKK